MSSSDGKTPDTIRLSAIQLDVSHSETPAARAERVVGLVQQLAETSDFITLPELWPSGAFDLSLGIDAAATLTELSNQGWLGTLQQIAADTKTWIHAGSFVERGVDDEDGQFFNTSVVISNAGEIAASYRKMHLFGFEGGEVALMEPGQELVVVDTPLGRTGFATCYDLRFPELFRQLVDRGAEAVLIPSGWPLMRISTWTTLAQARALENQMWVIGTNEAGTQNNSDQGELIELGGASIVVGPTGEVAAHGGENQEEVLTVEIDPNKARELRERWPVLKDRKL